MTAHNDLAFILGTIVGVPIGLLFAYGLIKLGGMDW